MRVFFSFRTIEEILTYLMILSKKLHDFENCNEEEEKAFIEFYGISTEKLSHTMLIDYIFFAGNLDNLKSVANSSKLNLSSGNNPATISKADNSGYSKPIVSGPQLNVTSCGSSTSLSNADGFGYSASVVSGPQVNVTSCGDTAPVSNADNLDYLNSVASSSQVNVTSLG